MNTIYSCSLAARPRLFCGCPSQSFHRWLFHESPCGLWACKSLLLPYKHNKPDEVGVMVSAMAYQILHHDTFHCGTVSYWALAGHGNHLATELSQVSRPTGRRAWPQSPQLTTRFGLERDILGHESSSKYLLCAHGNKHSLPST